MQQSLKLSKVIGEEEIREKVGEMGKALTEKYPEDQLVLVCVLKGSFMFFADLIREIDADIVCEFLGASSYQNAMRSSGEVKLTLDLASSVRDKPVLLVEDIVDTGLTMNFLKRHLEAKGAKSVETAALLLKPDALKVECEVDYVGFEISNDFVVGYGLDYQGHYRNLPYLAQVQSMN